MKKAILIGFIFIVAGCSSVPRDFISEDKIVPAKQNEKIQMDLRSISVSVSPTSGKNGNLLFEPGGGASHDQSFRAMFKDAVEHMIVSSAIFNDRSNKTVMLSAKITEFDRSVVGMSLPGPIFILKMTVEYKLIDRSNGKTVFSQNISSETEFAGNSFTVNKNLSEAQNKVVKENIMTLIGILKAKDIK